MSLYLEVVALQTPFNFNTDEQGRPMFSVNFRMLVKAIGSTYFEDEIADYLQGQGLITPGSDAWIGRSAVIPEGDGPFTNIINTGGAQTLITQNDDRLEQRSMQIVVRATNFVVAQAKAIAIWQALDGLHNLTAV